MSKKLIKSGLIVSTMTLLSRVLGLVRDVVIARLMGAEAAADVFFFANKIPNFLRRLFAEGAFAQAFVPAYARTMEAEGEEAARKLAEETLRGLLAVTVGLVIIAQIAATVWPLSCASRSD